MFGDFKMSLQALRYTKLRSTLSIICLAIGIATILTVILAGLSIKSQTDKQLLSDSSKLTIVPGHNSSAETILSNNFDNSESTLSIKDVQTLQDLTSVKSVAGAISMSGVAQASNKVTDQVDMLGVTPGYLQLAGGKLATGQLLESVDNTKVVVLGSDIARQFFGSTNPIGQTITVRGLNLTVVGVLRDTPVTAVELKRSLNKVALVPVSVVKDLGNSRASLQSILIDTTPDTKQMEAIQSINSSLLINHQGEQDFSIITPNDIESVAQKNIKSLIKPYLLMAIIPLALAFIGLLNVTLASVAERTREIGIRKSIGATNGQIAFQFITEALVIGALGALLALVVSHTLLIVLQTHLHIIPVISFQVIVVTFFVTIVLSILFTLMPAIYASRRNPIDALRYE